MGKAYDRKKQTLGGAWAKLEWEIPGVNREEREGQ